MSMTWPILTTYDGDHLARISLPLGGVGTGTISLGGRGNLRDVQVMNKGTITQTPADGRLRIALRVGGGSLRLRRLAIDGLGAIPWNEPRLVLRDVPYEGFLSG